MSTTTAYEGWALVEQMGFRRTVGRVREVEQYGTKMLRLDVPVLDGVNGDGRPNGEWTTRFAGGPSLYQVTPLDEELALDMVRQQGDQRPPRPVSYRLEDRSTSESDGIDFGVDDDDERDGDHG